MGENKRRRVIKNSQLMAGNKACILDLTESLTPPPYQRGFSSPCLPAQWRRCRAGSAPPTSDDLCTLRGWRRRGWREWRRCRGWSGPLSGPREGRRGGGRSLFSYPEWKRNNDNIVLMKRMQMRHMCTVAASITTVLLLQLHVVFNRHGNTYVFVLSCKFLMCKHKNMRVSMYFLHLELTLTFTPITS